MDPVLARVEDADVLEPDAGRFADLDAVVAADRRDVLQRHAVGGDDDPAADDAADHGLLVVEDERPLDDAVQMDDGRARRPGDAAGERQDRRDAAGRERPGSPQLAPVLGVGELEQREAGVAEDLRPEPGEPEDGQCRADGRLQVERVDEAHRPGELDEPQRQRRPTRLVREQRVVHGGVERDPDGEHQGGELDRPPRVDRRGERRGDRQRQERGGEPRLEASLQRVRHRRRKPWAT